MRGRVRRERTTLWAICSSETLWAGCLDLYSYRDGPGPLSLHTSRDGGGETAADCSNIPHTRRPGEKGRECGGCGREDEVGNATNRRRPRPARAAKRQALPWAGASKALQLLAEASQLYVFKQLGMHTALAEQLARSADRLASDSSYAMPASCAGDIRGRGPLNGMDREHASRCCGSSRCRGPRSRQNKNRRAPSPPPAAHLLHLRPTHPLKKWLFCKFFGASQ
jgi:hypothetical protein